MCGGELGPHQVAHLARCCVGDDSLQALTDLDADLTRVGIALAPRDEQQHQSGIPTRITDVSLATYLPLSPDLEGDLRRVQSSDRGQSDHGDFGTGNVPQALDEIVHLRGGRVSDHEGKVVDIADGLPGE